MPLEIAPFAPEHVEAAAALLIARNARHAAVEPAVGALAHMAAAGNIRDLLAEPGARGVFARLAGQPAGYLIAQPVLGGAEDLEASDYPLHSAVIPSHGHAVRPERAHDHYRDLYAALADALLPDGWTAHRVVVPSSDRDAIGAWFSVEFGLHEVTAVRAVERLPAIEAGVEIRRHGVEAIDDAVRFCALLDEHLAGTPSFFPLAPDVAPAWRAITLEQMAKPENGYFFAYRDGRAIGMASFMEPWALSPAAMPPRCVYLDQGVVERGGRGGGVGRALLAAGMEWAASEAYDWCALDYVSSNLVAARFWPAAGFRPLQYRLVRQVDERIVNQLRARSG